MVRRSALVVDAARQAMLLVGDHIGHVQRGHEWTRQFVAEMEKPSALLRQSGNGTHEQQAV
jgi:hypothetical protein